MRLIRFGEPGSEKPGIVTSSGLRLDVSGLGEDFDERFFATNGISRLKGWLNCNEASAPIVPATVRSAAPIVRPSKIICIGLNYRDHAAETGATLPTEPKIFSKATSALSGPFDPVRIPPGSAHTDWEAELAVVIGTRAAYVSEADALSHVAGYAVMNDYSERHWQKDRGGQWIKGKSFDSFAPLGPCLVTRDEVPNPQSLRIWLKKNGELRQESNTAEMVFSVATIVSYLSQCMSLLPGDIISTGTPAGVGLGRIPPEFLAPGDRIELGIDGIGEMAQIAEQYSPVE